MTKKILEITLKTAKRLGFYNEVPEEMEVQIIEWYIKEGDVIGFTEDKNTGNKIGQALCLGANTIKGEQEITAEGWEIGTKVSKILMPADDNFTVVKLYEKSLPLLELETEDSDQPKEKTENTAEEFHPSQTRQIRISPLAELAAKENKVNLQEVISWLPPDTPELTTEHILQFMQEKNNQTDGTKPQEPQLNTKAAPKTRRRAKEFGIDLSLIHGAGPEGLVTMADLQNAINKQNRGGITEEEYEPKEFQQTHTQDFDIVKPSMRRLSIARNLQESAREPLVHPATDIDAAPLIELRSKMKDYFGQTHGAKLSFNHFFLAACSWLLSQAEFRILNSYWHEENGKPEIRIYKHVNIGIAVAISPEKTRSGLSELIVPVIKQSEKLNFVELFRAAEELITMAINNKIAAEYLMDLTFTVNNVGAPLNWRGIELKGTEDPNNPIVPPKTCAILGIGSIREEFGQKKMRLVLGFNHKIADGYEASLFLGALRYFIEHPEQILVLK